MFVYQGPYSLDVLIPRAQKAIDDYKSKIGGSKEWFQKLLDILKQEKVARIQLYTKTTFTYDEYDHKEEFVDFIDVERISHTHDYASFFDIYSHENLINFDFEPIEVNNKKYKLTDFYNKYYKINEWS